MMRRIIVAGMLILCFAAATAITVYGASNRVKVVVDQDYPPYMSGTATQVKGLYPALIRAIFARMGMKVEIEAVPWKRALREGKEGKAAVGGIYKNKARLEIYDYSAPLFEELLAVYAKKGKTFHFTQLSDLQGKVIGLNRGWSYGDAFDAARKKYHFTVEEADNMHNFKKLVAGKIDCLVADEVAASRIIHKENLSNQVERLEKPAAVNDAYLVFAKRLSKKGLLERFNRTLAEMRKDGSYGKLVQEFIIGGSE